MQTILPFWIDARCSLLVAGYWLLVAGYSLLVARYSFSCFHAPAWESDKGLIWYLFFIRCWTFDVRCLMFISFLELSASLCWLLVLRPPTTDLRPLFLHFFPFKIRCSSFLSFILFFHSMFDVGRSMFDVHLFPCPLTLSPAHPPDNHSYL